MAELGTGGTQVSCKLPDSDLHAKWYLRSEQHEQPLRVVLERVVRARAAQAHSLTECVSGVHVYTSLLIHATQIHSSERQVATHRV